MRLLNWLATGALGLLGSAALSAQPLPALPMTQRVTASEQVVVPALVADSAKALTKADVDTWLDGYLPFALHSGDIPGAVVTVVKDGQILTARGFGYADIARRIPVDPNRTLFRPGSVSKLVTWTAVMQLVEAGKLDLDTDVNRYLDFRIPPFDGKPMTLRQIMTHTSGIEEVAKDTVFFDPDRMMSLAAFMKRWTPKRIFAPGTTPSYSNWATALAGYIVERQSGMGFDNYVDAHIFAPLGMVNSTFRQPLPARLTAQMATGYSRASEPGAPYEWVGPAPAGSLASTGVDMARFMIAHLQGGEIDGQRILSAATAATMHDSPLAKVDRASLLPPLNRMELGFFETNINGHEVIGHLGDTQNFHTSLHLFIRDGVGLYVSFNGRGKDAAVGPLRTALFQDFADRYFPETGRDGRVAADVAAEHARMMVGNWESSQRAEGNFVAALGLLGQTQISVGPKGELIVPELVGPGGGRRQWIEIAPFIWRDVNGHERLAAKVEGGKVVRWSWELVAPFMVYARVPAWRSAVWILPAMIASLGILVLTFLFWPIAWVSRRMHGVPTATGRSRLLALRGLRAFAGLSLAVLIGWAAAVSAILTSADSVFSSDGWLLFLQGAGIVVFIGAVLLAVWNLWLSWRNGRRWTGKVWSVLLLLATLMTLYVAAGFGLLAMTTDY